MHSPLLARFSIVLTLIIAWSGKNAAAADDRRPTTAPSITFTGKWLTSFGPMELRQDGEKVTGSYTMPGQAKPSTIFGLVKDRRLTFEYTEPNAAGEGWFELAADASTFAGKWRPAGSQDWGDWRGRRDVAAVDRDAFTGLWKTSYGRMRLWQTGKDVRGVYQYAGGSRLRGTVAGKTLKFDYDQPDGEKGTATFTLAPDGMAMAGTWAAAGGQGGQWSGSRLTPQSGRVWLVVIESNWEHGLEEDEYAYGLMLRTLFARVPSVRVRHRIFSDAADLKRWCGELTYLAEPVYLHLSSHGTTAGLTAGGETIGGEALAGYLKDAGDLRLVHFGACMVAGGDIPTTIQDARRAAGGAAFPISGYANVADWGGSAAIDFLSLDLIFSKGLTPAEAYSQTRRMISFAGEKANPGDAIAPAAMKFIEPPAGK